MASTVSAPLRLDAADDVAHMVVEGAAQGVGNFGNSARDKLAVAIDGLGGVSEARGEDVAVRPQALDCFRAACAEAFDDDVRMSVDSAAS